jgi:hypothetical protein
VDDRSDLWDERIGVPKNGSSDVRAEFRPDSPRFLLVATQLGFAPVELGRRDKGGVPLHVLGGQPGGLLFQNLVKLG